MVLYVAEGIDRLTGTMTPLTFTNNEFSLRVEDKDTDSNLWIHDYSVKSTGVDHRYSVIQVEIDVEIAIDSALQGGGLWDCGSGVFLVVERRKRKPQRLILSEINLPLRKRKKASDYRVNKLSADLKKCFQG